MKWWPLVLVVVVVIALGTSPEGWRWLVPLAAWTLDPGDAPTAPACDSPWRTWASVYRGSRPARIAYPCARDVVAGERGDSLRRGLADTTRPLARRREWARLLLVAGPAEDLLASASLPVDVRRGLFDEVTMAHAQDDLLPLAASYPLGGVHDDAVLFESLARGVRDLAEPVLAESPTSAAREPLLVLAAGLLRGQPASTPAESPRGTVLAAYGPVGEALAEHVFAEWAALRAWVASGPGHRERAARAMAVLVGAAPGEPWMSVHALVRGERVVPVLVGLAAIDLGLAASLPVRARGDADEVLVSVGHLAVYAPRCGPRRPVALPGWRPSPADWGDTTAAQLRRAAILADDWGDPCGDPAPRPRPTRG